MAGSLNVNFKEEIKKFNNMKNLFVLFLFLIQFGLYSQEIYYNFDDFKEAASAAKPGDEIILAAGRYEAESITIEDVAGTAENPVIIRAEEIGADTLDAGTYFDLRHCSYITIQGFVINISEKSTTFKIQTCNNIRISQNVLDGSGEDYYKDNGTDRNSSVWISIQSLWNDETGMSHHNRIDHNIFKNKQTLGNMIRIDGTNELYVSQYDVIEYNHFLNMGPRAENEMEAIRIGWSAMSESDGFCNVSNNLFEECNGDPEIISVKCNKNTISHNTFRRCQGTLSLRHGNESIVEGNFFLGEEAEGTGGVRIYGSDHKIINNYFEGLKGTKWDAPITLTYGDAEEGSGSLSKHFRIERAIIANNSLINNDHGIEIGYDNNDKYSKPPRDVIMAYNLVTSDTGILVSYINSPDNMTWINNLFYAEGDAQIAEGVIFTSGEVTEANPALILNDSLGYYKAGSETPEYIPSSAVTGDIVYDLDGQLRSDPTQYGADEFQDGDIYFYPLTAKDVGPDQGEYLRLSVGALDFPVSADTLKVRISTNLDWLANSDQSWLKINPEMGSGDDELFVMVEKNESGQPRYGNISVESTNAEDGNEILASLLISQAEKDPPFMEVSANSINFSSESGSAEIELTSNVDWEINFDVSWLQAEPGSGNTSATINVLVDENMSRSTRKAILTINGEEGLYEEIAVSQEGSVGSEEKLRIIDAIASVEQTESGNIADNVYDGILTNRWSGEGDGAYIDLELESLCKVSFIKVGLYKGNERHSYFDLQASEDGVDYFDILTDIISEITDESLVIYDFPDTSARFIRIVGHGNSDSEWNSYTEFELWGWKPVGINKKNNPGTIQGFIYPNPSDGIFTLVTEPGTEVRILDLNGQLMRYYYLEGTENTLRAELPSGIYILKFSNKNRDFFRRFVVR